MRIQKIAARLEIVAEDGPTTIDADLEALVQALWSDEIERRGSALFNGRIFSVTDVTPDRITGGFVEYRRFVAQRRRPDLFNRLRVRPLAVSGLVESPDGWIFGRRSSNLTTDRGKWELAPSGGLEPETCLHLGLVDYMRQFYQELVEELGIEGKQISSAVPLVLVEDLETRVFDLVIAARTMQRAAQIRESFLRASREYSELRLVPAKKLPEFIAEQGSGIVSLTATLLSHRHELYPG